MRACSTCGYRPPSRSPEEPPKGDLGAAVRLVRDHPELADAYGPGPVLDVAARWSA